MNNQLSKNESLLNDEIDLSKIFITISRYKNFIAGISGASLILSIIYAYSIAPTWEGSFQIVLRNKGKENTSRLSRLEKFTGTSVGGQGNVDLNTEVAILRSPSVLNPVYLFSKDSTSKKGIDTSDWTYQKWVDSTLNIALESETSILNIRYQDKDKSIIIPILNKISTTYQEYSGKDRELGLTKSINYVNSQIIKMKVESYKSIKELQEFSLKHNLGNFDGMIAIGSGGEFENNESNTYDFNQTRASERFISHMSILEDLEAELIEKSSLLTNDSEYIKRLKSKINALKESLKRPREILLTYRELKRKAIRDDSILSTLENQIRSLNLEKARQNDPWQLISTPTVLDVQVAPVKKVIALTGLICGILLSTLLSFLYEFRRGKIKTINDFKRLLSWNLLKTFPLKSKKSWENSIKILFKRNLKIEPDERIAFFILSENDDKNIDFIDFSDLIRKNIKQEYIFSSNINKVLDYSKIILLASPGMISYNQLVLIKEELNVQENQILGWIYFDPYINI
tara:strand:+ start:4122 stop:5666 length:1545 start_codon:yes stop_codon:yes gene_type:complete